MNGKRFKALTVVLMAMAVTLPCLAIPAAAVLPAQIGAVGNFAPNLDNSNLLTEVRQNSGQRNNGNWNGHHYGSGWGFESGADYYVDHYYGDYHGNYNYGGGGHVRWCLNRYRSYNPRTDTFVGHDGYRHRCRSPY
jgi:hypothetical protein